LPETRNLIFELVAAHEASSPMQDDWTLTIHLLGGFRIASVNHGVVGLEHARLQDLLAYLLLQRGRPVPRQHLSFLLWPDSSEKQARTNLRNLWHRLRRALPELDSLVATGKTAIQWRADASYKLDVAEFEAALAQARIAADPLPHLEQAVALYGGELLPGSYHDWLLAERERLAQAYVRALVQLAALHEERRQYPDAVAHVRALLRHDPLHEPAYALLMRLHALVDDRAAALHTYQTCVTVLRRELDVEPGRAIVDLYERLLEQTHTLPTVSAQPAASSLVGRATEWARLQGAWREAVHRPRLALISGEAGIGKTRLAEALAEWVQRQGVAVLTARCYGAESDLPYAPVVAWLHSQPLPLLADPWLRELARLLPELLVEHPSLPPPGPLTEPWQRLHLFQALAQALLNSHSAVLLLLEDVQWCDRDTLDWLHHVLTAPRGQGSRPQVLVAATLRSEVQQEGIPLAAWQTQLTHAGRLDEITLGPLNPEATLTLAGHVAGQPLDPALAAALYPGTEGNPLFIVEMVRAGFNATSTVSGNADHATAMLAAPTPLPARVRQVLEARLDQLSLPARSVIELAAVLGREFSYSVLARASDLSEDVLVGCLDECWRRRIIREQGEEGYDFSHDKLREVAYTGLSRTRRRWLHGQAAHALESVHASNLDFAAGAIGGHYEAAGRPSQAIPFYQQAAAAAQRIYAHADALAVLEKAIALLPALPAASAEPVAALHEALGDLTHWLTQHDRARAAYDTALASTAENAVIDRARLQCKYGNTWASQRASYDQALARYEAAEALLGFPPRDENETAWWEEWCEVQVNQLLLHYWWDQSAAMAARMEHVAPLIERHGTAMQRSALYSNLARQLNRSSRFEPSDQALDYARAAVDTLPPDAAPEVRGSPQFSLGFNLLMHGDHTEAERALLASLAIAEQTGDMTMQTRCVAYLTVTTRRQAGHTGVERYARRCLDLARAANMYDYIGVGQAGLAWVAWQRSAAPDAPAGLLAETEQRGRLALEAWQQHPAIYPLYWQAIWPLLGVALAQGRLAEAIPHARILCAPEQQVLPAVLAKPLAAALSAWDAGRPDEAHEKLQTAVDQAQDLNFS
jgi:DNA-binding SARP family transcriptional activator